MTIGPLRRRAGHPSGAPTEEHPPGYIDVRPLTGEPTYIRLLTYDDGSIRFEHACKLNGEPTTAAPLLRRHTITQRNPVSLMPAIICVDCGIHGHVVAGEWCPLP